MTFLFSDSCGSGGKGTAAPLLFVRDAHASGADHQAPPDVMMRPEYADELVETGCGDSGKVNGGDLKSNGGGRSGVF